jgi:anaerobic selenocysteine-containing dehydrogenase
VLVDVDDDGRPLRVRGDRANPVYRGFTCEKGRQLPDQHTHPERLLHTMRRGAGGVYEPVTVDDAVADVAARLRAIVDAYGPRAVAVYTGTCASRNPAAKPAFMALMDAIGSPMRFDSNTIDQPGKAVAAALHGTWGAPAQSFDDADVTLLIGGNPFVALSGGIPNPDPVRRAREARARGMQLLVIDPRRTETAAAADLHLQPVPGEDIAIVAALLHVILREGWQDAAFVAAHVAGVDELRSALAPFTPEHAAERAGLTGAEIVECARRFATARRGVATSGTGPSLQGRGSTLLEYLVMVLNTVCGRYLRAGERVWNPGVLLPEVGHKAQPNPPRPAYGYGEHLRVRGLADAACGLSTAALADEMLLDGPGRVRALLCLGGNPAAAWPDHDRTVAALRSLDLLVTFDIKMSATAGLAHYVVAPRLTLEIPGTTYVSEVMYYYAVGFGLPVPYAQYAPAIAAPPPGADVVEEWRFLARVAAALGTPLEIPPNFGRPSQRTLRIDDDRAFQLDDLLDHLYQNSRVPLARVRAHERGHVYDDAPVVVEPADTDCTARLDAGNAEMLVELEAAREPWWPHDDEHPFRLVCRRHVGVLNSSGLDLPRARARPYNPAFVHPDDLASVGLASGDLARVASSHGAVLAVVEADPTLRRGVVSMTHAYGDVALGDTAVRRAGTNTSRLTVVDDDFDRITGMPRMSNLPVSLEPAGAPGDQASSLLTSLPDVATAGTTSSTNS